MVQLLRIGEVTRRTGLSRASVYRLMADGHFPRSVRLSSRTTAWVLSEIDEWIGGRIQASRMVLSEVESA